MVIAVRYFFPLNRCSGAYDYLLVNTDHSSLVVIAYTGIFYTQVSYTLVYSTGNNASHTAAQKILNDFILTFGMPKQIVNNEGKELDKIFNQLTKLCGVK